jgi:hypothetical protein
MPKFANLKRLFPALFRFNPMAGTSPASLYMSVESRTNKE